MPVESYKEKVAIFEAAQVTEDPQSILDISEWLGQNEWPLLNQEQIAAPPGPGRQRGHFLDAETGTLMILWPEDINSVPVGQWIVKNRRYNDLEFVNDEDFSYKYEQYGS